MLKSMLLWLNEISKSQLLIIVLHDFIHFDEKRFSVTLK